MMIGSSGVLAERLVLLSRGPWPGVPMLQDGSEPVAEEVCVLIGGILCPGDPCCCAQADKLRLVQA